MSELSTAMPSEVLEAKTIQIGVDPAEAYERGKTDINFFAALCLPQIFIYALPIFYIMVWQVLALRGPEAYEQILRFALGLPRGHAKTTFIKVLIAWFIAYDKVSFILIVCANEGLAEQLLADLNDILGSPNFEAIYGPWANNLSTDTKDLKKALYHGRAIVLTAKGAGSSLRGLNIKNKRPDLIFCDDMQTRENDESPTERERLMRWMVATLFKVIAPNGPRLIIYVGNMYSEECILYKLQHNDKWLSFITGAILSNGEPLWPELHSLEALMESYYHDEALGQAHLWFAEVMNDPTSAARTLLPNPLPFHEYAEDLMPDGVFITIDPAGFRRDSDDNVIIVHYIYNGKGLIAKTITHLKNPEEIIRRTLQEALEHGASLIGIEDVGYQQTLQFWMNHFMREWGISGIHVIPLNPHGRSKEARIRLFIEELYAGNYAHLSPEERAAFVWQATKYKIGKKDNKDDLLDASAYGLDVRNEYWHLITNLKTVTMRSIPARVVGNNTPF
jgi:hypothetical protein